MGVSMARAMAQRGSRGKIKDVSGLSTNETSCHLRKPRACCGGQEGTCRESEQPSQP